MDGPDGISDGCDSVTMLVTRKLSRSEVGICADAMCNNASEGCCAPLIAEGSQVRGEITSDGRIRQYYMSGAGSGASAAIRR